MLVAAQDTHSENRMASYYRARYYDPNPGRFLSEDPIRFKAGVNAYAYVRNRPNGLRDPKGLRPTNDTCLKDAVNGWVQCLLVSGIVVGAAEGTCLTACLLSGPGWPLCALGCTEVIGGIEDATILICTAAAAGAYYDCKTQGPCKKK